MKLSLPGFLNPSPDGTPATPDGSPTTPDGSPAPPNETPATPHEAPATVRRRREGAVLYVELHAPDTGNAVTEAMLDELLAVVAVPDPEVRVLVLSAAGDDFSLGGDRAEFADWLAEDPSGRGIRVAGEKARRVCEALSGSRAVTIARVQGKAVGAGFALALACDLRVGAENASFRLPELALGLPTAWGGLLPRARRTPPSGCRSWRSGCRRRGAGCCPG